jgi:hypothetical protein
MLSRPRRLLVLAVVGAAVALAVGLLWPRTAITRANAERIRVGMALAEVEAILGGPARVETTGPTDVDWDGPLDRIFSLPGSAPGTTVCEWQSDHVLVTVWLGTDGRADWVTVHPMCRAYEGPLALLRRWLGR